MKSRLIALALTLASCIGLLAQQPSKLEHRSGDHIAIVGNALPEIVAVNENPQLWLQAAIFVLVALPFMVLGGIFTLTSMRR